MTVIRGTVATRFSDQLRYGFGRRFFVFCGVGALLFLGQRWREESGFRYDSASLVGGFVAGVLLFAALYTAVLLLVAGMRFRRLGSGPHALTYEIDGDKIVETGPNGMSKSVPWTAVRSMRETDGALWLSLQPGRVLRLPVRAFAAADLDALRALAREKLGAAARL